MADQKNDSFIPELTLTPDLESTLAPTQVSQIDENLKDVKYAQDIAVQMDESQLSEAEKKAVLDFSKKIDITDANLVLQYGAGAQKNVAEFSGSALENVRTKDMGEVGGMIKNLVVELKGFDVDSEKKGGLFGLFKKWGNELAGLKASYDKAEVNVDKIAEALEKHQIVLLKDVATLDQMYDLNLNYFKELSLYILAGKTKLADTRTNDLPALYEKARQSGQPQDAQAANDMSGMCNRFEKKLHDLELTRTVSIQMAPQIRLLQNNDSLMVEKIQSSLVNTIPLWKSQMVLALGLAHSQQAMEAQREVSDMTNELLRKNADTLKMGTIETAKESERSIIDIETLKHTNESLIATLDEVAQIQQEGARKRREAEVEISRIESELKQKLLELRG